MSDGDVADACRRRHNAAITTTYVDVDTPTDTEQEDVDVSAERTRVSTWDMSEQVTSPSDLHYLIIILSIIELCYFSLLIIILLPDFHFGEI